LTIINWDDGIVASIIAVVGQNSEGLIPWCCTAINNEVKIVKPWSIVELYVNDKDIIYYNLTPVRVSQLFIMNQAYLI